MKPFSKPLVRVFKNVAVFVVVFWGTVLVLRFLSNLGTGFVVGGVTFILLGALAVWGVVTFSPGRWQRIQKACIERPILCEPPLDRPLTRAEREAFNAMALNYHSEPPNDR